MEPARARVFSSTGPGHTEARARAVREFVARRFTFHYPATVNTRLQGAVVIDIGTAIPGHADADPPAHPFGAMTMLNRTLIAAALTLAFAGAHAQTNAATTVQRDVNQQTRIENGLKDGSLSTREGAKLEREESRVERLQARDLKDGKLSPAERAQLNAAQNKVSRDVAAARHNTVTGNPDSASSQRMQADVARNVSQQKRIEAGVQNGALTNHEVARLEAGQSHVNAKEARAGADGHVGAAEQASVQRSENRQSRRIRHEKHDAQVRG
jgi:hypothetical protein